MTFWMMMFDLQDHTLISTLFFVIVAVILNVLMLCDDFVVVLLSIWSRLCGLCTLILLYGFINVTRYDDVLW